jgi:hypothetical protein
MAARPGTGSVAGMTSSGAPRSPRSPRTPALSRRTLVGGALSGVLLAAAGLPQRARAAAAAAVPPLDTAALEAAISDLDDPQAIATQLGMTLRVAQALTSSGAGTGPQGRRTGR